MFKFALAILVKLPLINRVFYKNDIVWRQLSKGETVLPGDLQTVSPVMNPNNTNGITGMDSYILGSTDRFSNKPVPEDEVVWRQKIVKVKR